MQLQEVKKHKVIAMQHQFKTIFHRSRIQVIQVDIVNRRTAVADLLEVIPLAVVHRIKRHHTHQITQATTALATVTQAAVTIATVVWTVTKPQHLAQSAVMFKP